MFVKMITYDSEYGDANQFDNYAFSAESPDELIRAIVNRFKFLLESRTLLIDRENGFVDIVEMNSGKSAESYLIAYPSKQASDDDVNTLLLADGMFYDPDSESVGIGTDATVIWERLSDEDEEVIEAWGLSGTIDNQPTELGGAGYNHTLRGVNLTRYLFNLYQNHLSNS
jgi:hypothetical protein